MLDATGDTPSGPGRLYVTDAMIELALDPEVLDGRDFSRLDACGDYCIDVKDDDRTRWLNLTMRLCTPDAELRAMLARGTTITALGDTIGYKTPDLGVAPTPNYGVSIEVFTWNLDSTGKVQDGLYPWRRWVLPRTKNWREAGRSFNNDILATELVGIAITNDNWGNGPANDWPYGSTLSPLMDALSRTIPDTSCGVQTLPLQR
jgi:hypothetical protein